MSQAWPLEYEARGGSQCHGQKGQKRTWFVPSLAEEAEDRQSRELAEGHSACRQDRWAGTQAS